MRGSPDPEADRDAHIGADSRPSSGGYAPCSQPPTILHDDDDLLFTEPASNRHTYHIIYDNACRTNMNSAGGGTNASNTLLLRRQLQELNKDPPESFSVGEHRPAPCLSYPVGCQTCGMRAVRASGCCLSVHCVLSEVKGLG